jgi:hypothetical protein
MTSTERQKASPQDVFNFGGEVFCFPTRVPNPGADVSPAGVDIPDLGEAVLEQTRRNKRRIILKQPLVTKKILMQISQQHKDLLKLLRYIKQKIKIVLCNILLVQIMLCVLVWEKTFAY